jgi:hypothetical protein
MRIERRQCSDQIGQAAAPIMTAAGEETDAGVDMALEAVAVEFDLVQPLPAGRRSACQPLGLPASPAPAR